MIRRITPVLALACVTLVVGGQRVRAQSPCAASKVAFVQSEVILGSLPEYVKAESLLTQQLNAYKLELQQAGAAFDSARAAYQDKSALLSATAKAAEIKKLQDQDQKIQARQAELDQKMTLQQQQLLGPTTTRVQEVIDGMRAEYSCAIIFDISGGRAGIASADKSLDLTQRVIDRLNATAAKTPPPPAAAPPRSSVIKPPTPSTRKP